MSNAEKIGKKIGRVIDDFIKDTDKFGEKAAKALNDLANDFNIKSTKLDLSKENVHKLALTNNLSTIKIEQFLRDLFGKGNMPNWLK